MDEEKSPQLDPKKAKAVSDAFKSAMLYPPKEEEKLKAEVLRKRMNKQPG